MSLKIYCESENSHISCILFEHGYLTYYSTYLFENMYVYCCDMYKGKLSQNFDLGLSFCLMLHRRRNFEKNYRNSQKLPVLYHKKTRA